MWGVGWQPPVRIFFRFSFRFTFPFAGLMTSNVSPLLAAQNFPPMNAVGSAGSKGLNTDNFFAKIVSSENNSVFFRNGMFWNRQEDLETTKTDMPSCPRSLLCSVTRIMPCNNVACQNIQPSSHRPAHVKATKCLLARPK